MTESEWSSSKRPMAMVKFLGDKTTQRKRNLFAAACFRSIWQFLTVNHSREAVETLERNADGEATEKELTAARKRASQALRAWASVTDTGGNVTPTERAVAAVTSTNLRDMVMGAADSTTWVSPTEALEFAPEEERQCKLVREIFGNPFRLVSLDPSWQTSAVKALAEAAYDERDLPAGKLQPDRLAILADALEDAGCDNADILDHLRSPGPHVRGCWALDLIIGKK